MTRSATRLGAPFFSCLLAALLSACALDDKPPPPPAIELSSRCEPARCPDYQVQVFADGRVVYIGHDIVKLKGRATSKLGKERLDHLLSRFRAANFPALRDEYRPPDGAKADTWRVQLTFRDAGFEKTVRFGQYGAPASLRLLVTEVNAVTDAQQWVCPYRLTPTGDLICPF